MSGFITLHRAAIDHPLFAGDSARLGAWFWLLGRACWKPTPFDIGGRIVSIARGQLVASRSQLAKAWGWKESAVERFLTRLQTEQMIGRDSGQGRSIITICNYSKYQDVADEAGQPTGQPTGQPSDSHRTAKEQGNKGTRFVEEEAKASPPTARAKKPDVFPKPEWADPDVWADFLENRRKKSRPNTATAYKRMLTDIAKLTNAQWPPGRLLEHATAQGWAGIYEPRDETNARSSDQPRQQDRSATKPSTVDIGIRLAAELSGQADARRDRPDDRGIDDLPRARSAGGHVLR